VALSEAVAALTSRWAELIEQVGEATRVRLYELVDELDAAPTEPARAKAMRRMLDLVDTVLPAGDAIRVAVDDARSSPRLAGTKPEWQHELARVAALSRPGASARRKPPVDAVLLTAPSLSPRNIRRRGGNPDQRGLIRLRRTDGSVALPRFQFTREGEPRALVLRINQLLDADTDPWGVADWWLCPNIWLAGTPVDLIDRLDDRTLVAAALAAVEG
jgi:hypothetical protein